MNSHKSQITDHQSLSVVLATRNEEQNITKCLESVKQIADEMIVVDEESSDKTRQIAEKLGAKVFTVKHDPIFHKSKQKALDLATGEWILQLDADERVTPELAKEIQGVIKFENNQIVREQFERKCKEKYELYELFLRHQKLIEKRALRQAQGEKGLGQIKGASGPGGPSARGELVAFFVPRRNFFLGKPLIHAGVYPDGVIRLVKKGKARFPSKSVHELMEIDGEVGWLFSDLEHHDSPTFERYLDRANRYTDLTADEYKRKKIPVNYLVLFYFSFIKPAFVFLNLYFRHKGFLDGMRGFIWSLFSALHYPLAYFKYYQSVRS